MEFIMKCRRNTIPRGSNLTEWFFCLMYGAPVRSMCVRKLCVGGLSLLRGIFEEPRRTPFVVYYESSTLLNLRRSLEQAHQNIVTFNLLHKRMVHEIMDKQISFWRSAKFKTSLFYLQVENCHQIEVMSEDSSVVKWKWLMTVCETSWMRF